MIIEHAERFGLVGHQLRDALDAERISLPVC